jgi:uncharacterized protein YndB with AHSA1/START domain
MGILIGIAGVIGAAFIMGLFVKKDYFIQREIVINKPINQVFDYVRHLKNQDNFSKWVMQDPNKKTEFRGTDGEVGFVYAWESKNKNAGKGEQEIKGITKDQRVDIEIRFEKPFKNIAQTPFITEAISGNQTRVKWRMEGRNTYPMNMMTLFLKNVLGKDMDTSLLNMKNILEKQ